MSDTYKMAVGSLSQLRKVLKTIRHCDATKNYEWRNKAVYHALALATSLGMPGGIRIDEDEPEWPVVYIELPTGQVSWHVPEHFTAWDGHDGHEKYQRMRAFLEGTRDDQLEANGGANQKVEHAEV